MPSERIEKKFIPPLHLPFLKYDDISYLRTRHIDCYFDVNKITF